MGNTVSPEDQLWLRLRMAAIRYRYGVEQRYALKEMDDVCQHYSNGVSDSRLLVVYDDFGQVLAGAGVHYKCAMVWLDFFFTEPRVFSDKSLYRALFLRLEEFVKDCSAAGASIAIPRSHETTFLDSVLSGITTNYPQTTTKHGFVVDAYLLRGAQLQKLIAQLQK